MMSLHRLAGSGQIQTVSSGEREREGERDRERQTERQTERETYTHTAQVNYLMI